MDVPSPIAPPTPGLQEETKAFYEALSELIRVYQFRDRDRICCYDVSVSQCYALEALVGSEMTLNDLAAHLYLDKSTASRIVDALERKEYVERAPHPTDRRALLLAPTVAGRELHARIQGELLREEEALLADFSPEVRHSMIQLLHQLARAAASRVCAGGGSCCRVP